MKKEYDFSKSVKNPYMLKRITQSLVLIFSICILVWAEGLRVPAGQPLQIQTRVKYDKVVDPFFNSDDWSYPWWIIKHDDGHFENTMGGPTDEKELPKLKHTAKCSSSLQYDHEVKFCEAKLNDDGSIELYIHDESASVFDSLLVTIKDGKFKSQFWTVYPGDRGDEGPIWTTKSQSLTLDKEKYQKGDQIKGRIAFECLQEVTNPKYGGRNPMSIKVGGIIKPVLK